MANTSTRSKSKLSSRAWPFVLAAALAYIVRAHEYLLKPQLYAEDGYIWLADAYNRGVHSLTLPLNGLFHLPERLFGFLFVIFLPLQAAPVIFNLTALALFCATAYYLFTSRTKILDNLYQRLLVLACLCLIANVDEFFFNFSNSIFLLGIIGVLIMIATKPRRWIEYIEKFIFAVSCFTLPFAWFYLPIALLERYKYKQKNTFFLLFSALGSVTQAFFYISSHAERSPVTFSSLISKYTLIEIYNQILIPATRFARLDYNFTMLGRAGTYAMFTFFILSVLAAVLVLKNSNRQVRYLIFFFVIMTAAALKSPFISAASGLDAIKFMSAATGGDRYFIFGIIGMAIIIAKFSDQFLGKRLRYLFLGAFLTIGLVTSIRTHTFYIQKNFIDFTQQYKEGVSLVYSSNGKTTVTVPENPLGWSITFKAKN